MQYQVDTDGGWQTIFHPAGITPEQFISLVDGIQSTNAEIIVAGRVLDDAGNVVASSRQHDDADDQLVEAMRPLLDATRSLMNAVQNQGNTGFMATVDAWDDACIHATNARNCYRDPDWPVLSEPHEF